MNVGELVIKLIKERTPIGFGLPGINILLIYDALYKYKSEIKHVTVKLEENAAIMGDVYGRLTGEPGTCFSTAGLEATNMVTGLAQAYSTHSPLIRISGVKTGSGRLERFHGLDNPEFQLSVFNAVTKWSVLVRDSKKVSSVIAKAYAVALEGRSGQFT